MPKTIADLGKRRFQLDPRSRRRFYGLPQGRVFRDLGQFEAQVQPGDVYLEDYGIMGEFPEVEGIQPIIAPAAEIEAPPSPERMTQNEIDRYLAMLEQPAPEVPQLMEQEGRGAFRLGERVHKPGRLQRWLAPGLAALAQTTGAMSPQQAERSLADVFYGPYERALAESEMAGQQRTRRLSELGQAANIRAGQARAQAALEREKRLGQPKLELQKVEQQDETGQWWQVNVDPATGKEYSRVKITKPETSEAQMRAKEKKDFFQTWLQAENLEPTAANKVRFEMEVYPVWRSTGNLPASIEEYKFAKKDPAFAKFLRSRQQTPGLPETTRLRDQEAAIRSRYAGYREGLIQDARERKLATPKGMTPEQALQGQLDALDARMQRELEAARQIYGGAAISPRGGGGSAPIKITTPSGKTWVIE